MFMCFQAQPTAPSHRFLIKVNFAFRSQKAVAYTSGITGLEPVIQEKNRIPSPLDGRVKPGHD
jgi:hypothetical protein